jgi:hypothetical protein
VLDAISSTVGADRHDGVTVLLRAFGVQQGPVRQLDGDTVVGVVQRLLHRRLRDVVAVTTGDAAEVLGVEQLDLPVTVTEQGDVAVVTDDVTGGVGTEDRVGEDGITGVAVGVVAVRLGPDAGVDELEAVSGGQQGMATVAERVQPVEAVDLLVRDHVEGIGVQGEVSAVIGGQDAGLRGVDLLGFGGRFIAVVVPVV